eukprot:458044-Amorphochlora_amoeboformis.AAC.1
MHRGQLGVCSGMRLMNFKCTLLTGPNHNPHPNANTGQIPSAMGTILQRCKFYRIHRRFRGRGKAKGGQFGA